MSIAFQSNDVVDRHFMSLPGHHRCNVEPNIAISDKAIHILSVVEKARY